MGIVSGITSGKGSLILSFNETSQDKDKIVNFGNRKLANDDFCMQLGQRLHSRVKSQRAVFCLQTTKHILSIKIF